MAAPTAESSLADAIKTGNFAPAYCLVGENEFRKDEAVRQVIAVGLDPSMRDLNLETLRGDEVDPGALAATLSTLPMLGERRIVVLRSPGALKKAGRGVLERYLANPSPQTLLLLVVPSDESVDAAISQKCLTVELKAYTAERLIKWIIRQGKTAFGADVAPEAAELLAKVVGDDLTELSGELDKLASYADGRSIDAATVSAVVGVRPGETMVDLLDAVADRDVRRALALVPTVLRQPKISGVTIVMALGTQTLGIAWCRAMRDAGESSHAVERAVFPMARRVPGFLSHRAAGATATAWSSAAVEWAAADVEAALDALLCADLMLKETRVESDEQVISTAVLTVCAGATSHAAAA